MTTRILDDWLLLPERFALHEPSATAVLADVHLGYSAARQRLGDAIPSRSVEEELQPLADAARMHDIRHLVVAGDLFECGYDADLWQRWLDVLAELRIRLAGVVPGNHDRGIDAVGNGLVFADGFDLGGWRILHGDEPTTAAKTVSGHWHPALRWRRRKVPCYLVRGKHLVLPAFSLDTAGADINADPRWRQWDCIAICENKLIRKQPVCADDVSA